jgi:hypothetical protein
MPETDGEAFLYPRIGDNVDIQFAGCTLAVEKHTALMNLEPTSGLEPLTCSRYE